MSEQPKMDEAFALVGPLLEIAVPLEIEKLKDVPPDVRVQMAHDLAPAIYEPGIEAFMFPDKQKGATQAAFANVARALALLAFAPGGVTAFGCHFHESEDTCQRCHDDLERP